MSNNSVAQAADRAPDRTPDGAPNPMDAGEWQQSSSLVELRAVLNTFAHVNQNVARRAKMSVSELLTLAHLSQDQIGPGEIARRLGVTTAASSGIVERMVARGYVERSPNPTDRRRTELTISDLGRRTVVQHLVPMFMALDRVDRGLDDTEREVVTRYLAGVREAFVELLDEREPGVWPRTD